VYSGTPVDARHRLLEGFALRVAHGLYTGPLNPL
jgi:hypothetical protein